MQRVDCTTLVEDFLARHRGHSAADAGKEAGISASTVSHMRHGQRLFRWPVAMKLRQHLATGKQPVAVRVVEDFLTGRGVHACMYKHQLSLETVEDMLRTALGNGQP